MANTGRNWNVRFGISTGSRPPNDGFQFLILSATRLWSSVSTKHTEACSDRLHLSAQGRALRQCCWGFKRGVRRKAGIWEIPDEAVYRTRGFASEGLQYGPSRRCDCHPLHAAQPCPTAHYWRNRCRCRHVRALAAPAVPALHWTISHRVPPPSEAGGGTSRLVRQPRRADITTAASTMVSATLATSPSSIGDVMVSCRPRHCARSAKALCHALRTPYPNR